MEPRDEVILRKALSEIDIAENRMGDHSLAEFNENEMLMRAICMTVINIGELVKTLSESFRRTHKYQTLKMGDVYETVQTDFPVLRVQTNSILEE